MSALYTHSCTLWVHYVHTPVIWQKPKPLTAFSGLIKSHGFARASVCCIKGCVQGKPSTHSDQ